jgi:hypothetical protein
MLSIFQQFLVSVSLSYSWSHNTSLSDHAFVQISNFTLQASLVFFQIANNSFQSSLVFFKQGLVFVFFFHNSLEEILEFGSQITQNGLNSVQNSFI